MGVVYSTNPEFQYGSELEKVKKTLSPDQQLLYVRLDRKNRKGKTVTLVDGFTGTEEELKSLGKELKSRCGTGGSAKDGEILVQGDFRDRIMILLKEKGFKVKRSGG